MFIGLADVVSEVLTVIILHITGTRFGSWLPLSTLLAACVYIAMQTITSTSQYNTLLALIVLVSLPVEFTICAGYAVVSSIVAALNRPSVALILTAFYSMGELALPRIPLCDTMDFQQLSMMFQ
jgi:hypothetical protein